MMRAFVLMGALACAATAYAQPTFRSNWSAGVERPWAGADYWANPLQDWRVHGGRFENIQPGGDRNLYLLTRQISDRSGTLTSTVRLGRLEEESGAAGIGFGGFRVGIRGTFNDYRDSAVRGYGMNAGITADGRLFIARVEEDAPRVRTPMRDLELRLTAKPAPAGYFVLLAAYEPSGRLLAQVERSNVPAAWFPGGIALVSHSGPVEASPQYDPSIVDTGWADKRYTNRGGSVRFWFRDWTVGGTKVDAHPDRAFGPILFTLHTLSRGVLKLTAQLAPVQSSREPVRLQIRESQNAAWRTVSSAPVDQMSRTATFRVPDWNAGRDVPYRVAYRFEGREHTWSGTVRRDPVDKPQIVVAAFTGNNDLGFPHADIVRSVQFHKPDLLAYTGDNIYERVGEYGIQREPLDLATLDYLRKWYIFGWEYRDLLRDVPAVCLPDDHDVYHGNIWGAGGRHAEPPSSVGAEKGGYTMPAEWVNMVQRTQTSHMMDPYDPTPVDQGITVYYGDLLYGGVSFAVIEDRKWKSSPTELVPMGKIVNGWPQNPDYDAATDGDVPGAELLGKRQEAFLAKWAHDWSGGAWMKAVISQTIFADVVTLPQTARSDAVTPKLRVLNPGEYPTDEAPVQDHDSNSWPQTPRNRALSFMRQGFAFHIAGDQHLGSTIQYGVDDWNDGSWALCVPSVANIFPRRWFPPQPGRNRKPGAPQYTGEFLDGFGNKMTVHAVSNPVKAAVEPAALYDRAPGYGIVVFDRGTRNITIANWPRWVDASKPGAKPYPGWPITIHQLDNGMPRKGWTLGTLTAQGMRDPVVEVTDEGTGRFLYAVRISGSSFEPKVPGDGVFTVTFTPKTGSARAFRGQKAKLERAIQ